MRYRDACLHLNIMPRRVIQLDRTYLYNVEVKNCTKGGSLRTWLQNGDSKTYMHCRYWLQQCCLKKLKRMIQCFSLVRIIHLIYSYLPFPVSTVCCKDVNYPKKVAKDRTYKNIITSAISISEYT